MSYKNRNCVTITGAKVEVRNGDVNGALRRLKKILDNDDRQKELSKREFFEKPSLANRRARQQAKKRTEREQVKHLGDGQYQKPGGTTWMKSKRKRRKVLDTEALIQANLRNKKG